MTRKITSMIAVAMLAAIMLTVTAHAARGQSTPSFATAPGGQVWEPACFTIIRQDVGIGVGGDALYAWAHSATAEDLGKFLSRSAACSGPLVRVL